MKNTKLIIIEGIPGSGKTTISKWISKLLLSNKINNKWFSEFDIECPVFSDVIKGFTNSSLWLEETYSKINWDIFVNYINNLGSIGIFESKLWQNYGLFLYLAGLNSNEIIKITINIYHKIKSLNPLLIYLKTNNVSNHIINVLDKRRYDKQGNSGYNFTEWFVKGLNNSNWFKYNLKEGETGVVDFMVEWSKICDDLFNQFLSQKLKIVDVKYNWKNAEQQIKKILRLTER